MLAALEARAAAEIATFDYPSRPWMLPGDVALNAAIIGYGHVGLMLALALRRERIDRVAVFRAPLDRYGVYAALAEPRRLPRLDFAGRELSVPSLGFPAWLAAGDKVPGALFGGALAEQWSAYLDWLARQIGVEVEAEAVSLRPHGQTVEIVTSSGVSLQARHGVLAWSAANVPGGCLAADLDSSLSGAGVAIRGHDAAAYDLALTALELGAEWVAFSPAVADDGAEAVLDGHDVVYGFPRLAPERQAALRLNARRIPTPPPKAWRQRLAADNRVRTDHREADVTLVAGLCLPALFPNNATLNADLSLAGWPTLSVLSPALTGPSSPVLHPLSLARFGVPIVNAAISRAIFLADADALFRNFLAFETAEGLGGRLLTDS
jgi:hypothetical protein